MSTRNGRALSRLRIGISKFSLAFVFLLLLIAGTPSQSQSGVGVNQNWAFGPYGAHTFKIATLVASSGATGDHLHLVATLNQNLCSGCNSYVDAFFANRNGFVGRYTLQGTGQQGAAHLAAYANSDGTVDIYLMFPGTPGSNVYAAAGYTVLDNFQETVYSSPVDSGGTTPPGTLVFDTASASYPPSLLLDYSGNLFPHGAIGLGTSAPQALFHVASPSVALASNGTAFGSGNAIIHGTGTRSQTAGAALTFAHNANTDGGLNWWEQGRIIATADNANNGDASGRLSLQTRYNNGSIWDWRNNLVLTSSGNVGINTTTPSQALEVNGAIKLSPGSGGVIFPDGSTQTTAYSGGSGQVTIANGSAATLLVQSTAAPGASNGAFFGLTGNARAWGISNWNTGNGGIYPGSLGIVDGTAGIVRQLFDPSGDVYIGVKTGDGSVSSSSLSVLASGNIGVGTTSPQNNLSVQGGLNIDQGGTNAGTPINAGPGGTGLTFGSGSGEGIASARTGANQFGLDFYTDFIKRVSITNTGSVGIGTVTPGQALEVNGNIKLSTSGNAIMFPDGSSLSSASSLGAGGNITASTLKVQGPAGGLIVAATNLDPNNHYSLAPLANSATMLVGWNYSAGAGEQDFISNRGGGGSGGFAFYDYSNSGVMAQLASMNTSTFGINENLALTGSGAHVTFPDGTVQSTAWNGTTFGGDYAESVEVSTDRAQFEPGDVITIDPVHLGQFLKSATPYSTMVAGVYSTKPGLTGRRLPQSKSKDDELPMAMVGIVPTKVSAENGPIHAGDLIVSSSTPGRAMKATDRAQAFGAVLGKALGSLESGLGVIEVLVTLQ